MSSQNQHTDLLLSRLIDQQNRGEHVVFPAGDDFVQQLLAFRDDVTANSIPSVLDSESMWDEINRATKPVRSTPVFTLQSLYKYTAAAILMIAAIWAVFMIVHPTDLQQFSSAESIKVVTLADGSTVTLRPFSTLTQTHQSKDGVSFQLSGEAFFDVKSNPDRVFAVSTADGRVEVLGTSFNVSTWGEQTRVYLLEGSVQVLQGDEPAKILEPGDKALLDETGIAITSDLAQDEIIHWMEQTLRFREREVQSILAELSHHFNITLGAPDAIQNQTLSGTIILSERDQTLFDLGLVLGGMFWQSSPTDWQFIPAQ